MICKRSRLTGSQYGMRLLHCGISIRPRSREGKSGWFQFDPNQPVLNSTADNPALLFRNCRRWRSRAAARGTTHSQTYREIVRFLTIKNCSRELVELDRASAGGETTPATPPTLRNVQGISGFSKKLGSVGGVAGVPGLRKEPAHLNPANPTLHRKGPSHTCPPGSSKVVVDFSQGVIAPDR
jgi:hypothetical protein